MWKSCGKVVSEFGRLGMKNWHPNWHPTGQNRAILEYTVAGAQLRKGLISLTVIAPNAAVAQVLRNLREPGIRMSGRSVQMSSRQTFAWQSQMAMRPLGG